MTQKIIALVDSSIYSASVCEHAAWIASRSAAAVALVHVMGHQNGSVDPDQPGAVRLGARSALQQELAALDAQRAELVAQRGAAVLADARSLLERAGVAGVTTTLHQGNLIDAVAAQDPGAAIIVIGKRSETADQATGHFGSNIERILRATSTPVLVAARKFTPIAKVLVAFDGGVSAIAAIDHTAQSPFYTGLAVDVISVGTASFEVKSGLAEAKARLAAAGIRVETGVIPGSPETALIRLVDEANFDLVVMGAYGPSRLASRIIGATATALIHGSKASVVLIRPGDD
ncbi:MAG: universal stress protein [Pseudorhodobacter sp.]|nr:universal stress protein [Pseudorhodobacter sp.]